jgi:hypothetical protein
MPDLLKQYAAKLSLDFGVPVSLAARNSQVVGGRPRSRWFQLRK